MLLKLKRNWMPLALYSEPGVEPVVELARISGDGLLLVLDRIVFDAGSSVKEHTKVRVLASSGETGWTWLVNFDVVSP